MNFFDLHHQSSPLLIANVWDVPSARAAEQLGYSAVGTSSAAMADMLGYADGDGLTFAELKLLVSRIGTACRLPLSVDVESGYGDSVIEVADNLIELARMGVVGVNLEDSSVSGGVRRMMDAQSFGERLRGIKSELERRHVGLFINVRTEAYLLGIRDALRDATARGLEYAACGANGLFVPGLTDERDIETLVKAVALPINVMCMPKLPAFNRLAMLGVKRISMGNFVHSKQQDYLRSTLKAIRSEQSFRPVFA